MTNKEIYKKTLGFSLRRVGLDALALVLCAGLAVLGAYIAEKAADRALLGLAVGGVVGLVFLVLILRFAGFSCKAAQIAMMTRAVTGDELPDDVIGEGRRAVKERFATVAAYFAATGVIRGIFQQIGSGIVGLGEKIGGDKGGTVGSVISSGVQTVVRYLCDCCLGWVFYRKEVKASKATCEGAAIFFKHGGTLIKNLGRVFGIGLVSLIAVGGPFTALFAWIGSKHPELFTRLSAELVESAVRSGKDVPAVFSDPNLLMISVAAIGGVIVWSVVHSVFIRPFVLVGVLRNFMESGKNDIPSEDAFAALDSRSPKFRKLHGEAA